MQQRILFHSRYYKALLAILLFTLFLFPAPKAAHAMSFQYAKYPTQTIGLSKPTIGILINQPDQNLQPSTYELFLNDKQVPVQYNSSSRTVNYIPSSDLAPGTYNVRLLLEYSGYQPKWIEWSFTVAKNAVSQLPSTFSQEQLNGLKAINDYRKLYGIKPLEMSGALTASASSHAQYLSSNAVDARKVSLHEESASLSGFTGKRVGERALYYGYILGVGEDVSYHTGNLIESIDSLFDAPYHRTPFLDPYAQEVGIAQVGDYVVINFGMKEQDAPLLTVSPSPGDPYVPVDFPGYESPDPLRMHTGSSYPVGYPLMVSYDGAMVKKVTLIEAKLSDSSKQSITLLSNSPSNDDHLSNAFILMPENPLKPDTTYSASVKFSAELTDGTTQTLEKQWSFHTEPVPGLGKLKLHSDAAAYIKLAGQPFLQHTVTFNLDQSGYSLDGMKFETKKKTYIENGSSYLWVRDLTAALGAEVTWDDANKAAIYSKNGRQVTLYTNRSAYAVNGSEQATDSPAKLIENYTMIPVRLLSEALGAKVTYDEATRTVTIQYSF